MSRLDFKTKEHEAEVAIPWLLRAPHHTTCQCVALSQLVMIVMMTEMCFFHLNRVLFKFSRCSRLPSFSHRFCAAVSSGVSSRHRRPDGIPGAAICRCLGCHTPPFTRPRVSCCGPDDGRRLDGISVECQNPGLPLIPPPPSSDL